MSNPKDEQGEAMTAELSALTAIVTALKPLSSEIRQRVIDSALTLLGVPPSRVTPPSQTRAEHAAIAEPARTSTVAGSGSETLSRLPERRTQVDIRSLKEEKNPSTGIEMATLVAYYLSEVAPEDERKATIGVEDVRKYFKQASFRLPNDPKSTLHNAKNAGYLDALGSGEFRLNAVGYNLIVHNLPSETRSESTKPRKRKPSKGTQQGSKKGSKKAGK